MKNIFFKSGTLFIAAFLLLATGCYKPFAFCVFSDTHCLDSLNRFDILDSMVQDVNTLSKNDLSIALPSGKPLAKLKGMLVCGDLTDDGKQHQWDDFQQLFGLYGDQRLGIPVYETFGNHDGNIDGIVRNGIKNRNMKRPSVKVSADSLFYSWNWEKFHFVSLGIYPGNGWDSTCNWCHYFKTSFRDPQNSLSFLESDLKTVPQNRRVVLFFHYGWDEFSKLWWTEAEQDRLYNIISSYNIAAIFTGHNHATGYMNWRGIDIYSSGSPQRNHGTGSFLIVQVEKDSLFIQERQLGKWGNYQYRKNLR